MTEIPERLSSALADRYRLERELGSGGMATVFLAHDVKHDRKVAVKVLRPELAAVLGAKRFVQEIKTTANLQHSHILPLFDSGEASSFLYYVMPFIDGESLRDRLDREKQLSINEAVRIASDVADALNYAHQRNVIHRDIKPENIMLRDEQVLVMDFGIAMALGSMDEARLTATGALIGTPQYMSPEQAAGESVGAASDVYALGSVLYEMLSGAAPHHGANIQAIIASVLSREPEPVRSVRSEVPPHIEQAIARALAMDPTDRFVSMSEFARALATTGSTPRRIRGQKSSERGLADSERRYATVVHSALTGYATLVEQLHPDDLEQLLERIHAAAQEIVEKHGGVLNSASDEESVAMFGAPVAHEDDALRAVRAARELQQFLCSSEIQGESRLGVRTGISTGFVVVRGSRREGELFSIAGGVVGVAARLAAHAADGDVLVSAESERLLVPFFSTEPLKPVTLGGESEITPHRIVGESGARTRIEAAERAGLTLFAGRDTEMRTLQECLKKSVTGAGQVISIVGEAGVGKSRLHYEFLHPLDPADVRVVEGRCQSIAEATPYLPFIETLRQVLKPASEVDLQEASVIDSVRALDPGLENYISLYLHVLSVPSSEHTPPKHLKGKEFRRAMLDGLSAVFALASKQRPLVMMLEDWHQADEASQEMLKHVAGIATAYPLMIVVTARPQVIPDVGEVDHHTMIRLGPLEATASLAVICSVLDVDQVADDLGRHLHERTAGNPFFLEEICLTMQEENLLRVESGRAALIGNVESLQLPDTVQAVLRSRLDRVDPDAREVLRLASVVGREFARDILERAVPDASSLPASLEALTALGMIQQISVVPEPVYRFKHALTQEAAYESLVQHQRKTLHGLVGKVLEEHYADRADEQSDIFAHHFSLAEQWPAAVRYGRRAAEKAHNLGQFANESRMLENVLGWVRKLDDRTTEIEVLLAWERTCETIGNLDQQQTIIENLLLLTEPDGYDRQRAETYIRQGDLWTLLRHFDKAQDVLTQSLEIWRTLSDRAGERNALRSLGFLGWHQGDLEQAVTSAEAALAIDRELADLEAVALGLNNLGMVLKAAGRIDEALRYFEEAVQLFEDKQIEETHALINAASIYRDRGEIDKAMRYLQKGYDVERRHHLTGRESFILTAMATIAQMQGRPDESIRIYEDLIRRSHWTGAGAPRTQ